MKPTVLTVTLNPSLDKTIVLDQLLPGMLNRAASVRLDPGGKGINVARLLHDYRIPVMAAGFAGGAEGEELQTDMKKLGIEVRFQTIAGRTRTNLKIVDSSQQVTTEINEPGAAILAAEREQFMELFHKSLQEATHLVLGGSIPPGLPVSVYRELIEAANKRDVYTILDADGKALEEGLQAKPFALKPNIHELEQWAGQPLPTEADIVKAGRRLLDTGVSQLIISMGAEGSIAMNRQEAYRVKPFPIQARSTVGAGDSMVATMIYCHIQGMSLRETAAWTAAAGTLTASKEGTQVCTLEEVQQNVNRIQVNPIPQTDNYIS